MKKKICSVILFFLILLVPFIVKAKEKVNVYFFYEEKDSISEEAINFFDNLDTEYKDYFILDKYEISKNKENKDLMDRILANTKEDLTSLPYILVHDKSFFGYNETMSLYIKDYIKEKYDEKNNIEYKLETDPELERLIRLIDIGIIIFTLSTVGLSYYISYLIKKKKSKN